MKLFIYILLILAISNLSCKRKRKINVEGTVTDVYTGNPVQNVKVKLYSQIETGVSGGTTNDYEQTTDFAGHFYFKNAVFSKPGNYGWLRIEDEIYQDIDWGGGHDIKGDEIKFIGKTNLTKNKQVICTSTLRLSLIQSSNIQHAFFYRKFIGTGYMPQNYSEFNNYGNWPATQTSGLINELVGYSDGKNIIKTVYYDGITQTSKTQYDTIISQGCGSINNYTITLN